MVCDELSSTQAALNDSHVVQYMKETYNAQRKSRCHSPHASTLRLPHVMFQTRPSLLLTVRMRNTDVAERPGNEARF